MLFCRKTPTTQAKIERKIEQGKIERVGITNDVERRRHEYEKKGYTGEMMFSRTDNKRKVEDKFLEECGDSCYLNIQKKSNAPDEPGYVYGINLEKH